MANGVCEAFRRKFESLLQCSFSEFFGVPSPVQTLDESIQSDPTQLVFPEFWNNGKYSDIDIVVENQIIPAHKIIRKRESNGLNQQFWPSGSGSEMDALRLFLKRKEVNGRHRKVEIV